MKKIIVIEDLANLREEIIEILECFDYEVIGAASGAVGVNLASQHLPDLIICDIMMPELDGYGVLNALHQNPATASIPFIFISAKTDKFEIRQGMNLGADDYLTKPFTIQELREAIAARLSKHIAITQPYITKLQQVESQLHYLLSKADIARSCTQQNGKHNNRLYPADISQLALADNVRHALERGEFQVYYQPQVATQTGKIVAVEALLRWIHPERGFVSPAEFIPLVEETGLMIPIGEWVLRTACQQVKVWQSTGFSSLGVAVNLSARQFNQPNLSESVCQILKSTGLSPNFLELELTESTLVQDIDAASKTLNQLNSLGVKIAIDDFGIGYCSLSYLKQLPFDTLKIDQCFVRNIAIDETNAAITTAIIQMAQSLKLRVIAEGVETEDELNFLYQQHCDAVQGYLFSRALSSEEFKKLKLVMGHRSWVIAHEIGRI